MNIFRKAFKLAGDMLHTGSPPDESAGTNDPPRVETTETSPERQRTTFKELVLSDQALAAHLKGLEEDPKSMDWLEPLTKPPLKEGEVARSPTMSKTLRSSPIDSLLSRPVELSEPVSTWRSLWLSALARPVESTNPSPDPLQESEAVTSKTRALVTTIFEILKGLADEFNRYAPLSGMRVTTTQPVDVRESVRAAKSQDTRETRSFYRCRASTASFSLSLRSSDGAIDVFMVPVSELMALYEAETLHRLKIRIKLSNNEQGIWWTIDGLPVDALDLRATVRRMFKDLIFRSAGQQDLLTGESPTTAGFEGERLAEAVNELVLEKQNLVQKIVIQQEEIQNSIARDLHDAVISDVMMLKRSLSGDKKMTDVEVIEVLDKITRHLREICNDLAPRDLKDWGLQTVIDDMLQRISERTGADCSLICDSDLPELPHPVQLHIFRIVQECLNNIEKYAEASKVVVTLDHSNGLLSLTIQDNGKGFSLDGTGQKRGKEGGKGLGGIKERADLIRCFYPTEVFVQSQPNQGSTTKLEIKLTGTFA